MLIGLGLSDHLNTGSTINYHDLQLRHPSRCGDVRVCVQCSYVIATTSCAPLCTVLPCTVHAVRCTGPCVAVPGILSKYCIMLVVVVGLTVLVGLCYVDVLA